LDACKAAEQK
jgi:hypothetical protein